MAVSKEAFSSISAPEKLDSRLGTLEFTDGVPSAKTAETAYDQLDFQHALNAYLNGFPGASTWALRKGFQEAGVKDNEILIFSELMDSQSLFLTANADTVYFVGIVDLTSGPMVVETPPDALALFDDMWFQWIIDFGLPGPDRSEGGRFLLVPPDYDGSMPDSGFHVGHSRTTRAILLGRSFINENPGQDPAKTVEVIKSSLKIYPTPKEASVRASGRCSRARCSRIRLWTFRRRSSSRGAGWRSTRSRRAISASSSCLTRRSRMSLGQQHQHRADGGPGRDRDRQGQAIQAG